uniref:Transposase, MuDR, MULE transposase domain protein n=1 Tax=Tanacetum cinerariifolium TaxID=118510 RepID=A0A6L2L6Z9_TANCI|nr:hypothetical protein [Tanacetum cinerariifolium]
MNRGSILHEDLTYAMLQKMVMKKFNLEAIYPFNLSAKVSSIDDNFDITDDHENHQENMFYNFFEPKSLETIRPSNNITNTSFDNNGLDLNIGTSHFHNNELNHKNESHFEKPQCSFAFGDYHEYEDEKNEFDDVVDEKPLPNFHKWQKYMSFKPDIPETPLYKSKSMISKDYKKETDVKVGKIFDNKEALDLAIRLKALDEGYQFLNDMSAQKERKNERTVTRIKTDEKGVFEMLFIALGTHAAIALAVQDEFPLLYHAVCCRHLIMNLSLKRDKTKALLWRICKAYTAEEFSTSMSHLQDIQTDAYDKLCQKAASVKVSRDLSSNGARVIRTFVNYLRPLLMIDVAHLKGQYKGTNLIAVGMDGNNQIVLIAFGICKGETGPCWSWWMSVPKECIEIKQRFYSGEYARLTQEEEFSRSMNHLQDIQTDAYDKLCQVGPQRWSRVQCPLVCYNYLTSNSVESVNACTVVYRKLPVLKLAETYRAMVQEWYYQRRKLTDFEDMISYLTIKISRRFTTLYYTLPPNNALSGLKQIKNDYDTNVMYDIARVAGKIQLFVSHHQIDLSTVLIPNDGSLKEALLSVLAKLQEALDEEDILADQILTMMHRYADRFTNRRVEINNLMVLQDHSLVDYGKYAIGCMTGADMKKCVHLKSVRDELLRSMEEKR